MNRRTVWEHDDGTVEEKQRADGASVVSFHGQDARCRFQVRFACDRRRGALQLLAASC